MFWTITGVGEFYSVVVELVGASIFFFFFLILNSVMLLFSLHYIFLSGGMFSESWHIFPQNLENGVLVSV